MEKLNPYENGLDKKLLLEQIEWHGAAVVLYRTLDYVASKMGDEQAAVLMHKLLLGATQELFKESNVQV